MLLCIYTLQSVYSQLLLCSTQGNRNVAQRSFSLCFTQTITGRKCEWLDWLDNSLTTSGVLLKGCRCTDIQIEATRYVLHFLVPISNTLQTPIFAGDKSPAALLDLQCICQPNLQWSAKVHLLYYVCGSHRRESAQKLEQLKNSSQLGSLSAGRN